jgi:hypothetical protein
VERKRCSARTRRFKGTISFGGRREEFHWREVERLVTEDLWMVVDGEEDALDQAAKADHT